jgi:hypothetical protein
MFYLNDMHNEHMIGDDEVSPFICASVVHDTEWNYSNYPSHDQNIDLLPSCIIHRISNFPLQTLKSFSDIL